MTNAEQALKALDNHGRIGREDDPIADTFWFEEAQAFATLAVADELRELRGVLVEVLDKLEHPPTRITRRDDP